MSTLLQDVIVTLAAIWAVWVIVRRLGSVVSPGQRRAPSCDNCASHKGTSDDGSAKPLTLVRERRS